MYHFLHVTSATTSINCKLITKKVYQFDFELLFVNHFFCESLLSRIAHQHPQQHTMTLKIMYILRETESPITALCSLSIFSSFSFTIIFKVLQ